MNDDRFMTQSPPRKSRMYLSSLRRHLFGRSEERDVAVGEQRDPASPCGTTERMSCDTTTLVTPSSRCSFMISRVIVPVVSGSSPDVGSS